MVTSTRLSKYSRICSSVGLTPWPVLTFLSREKADPFMLGWPFW